MRITGIRVDGNSSPAGAWSRQLKAARGRKRRETRRKVEGRKSYAEMEPDMVRLAL